jgi:ABC-type phosphate transport system substrate-binding protein
VRHLATGLVLLMVLLTGSRIVAGEHLAVIVHPSRATTLALDDVRRIYLRQRRFWGDGREIIPINRVPESAARAAFTRHVFGTAQSRLAAYWNERYFQGVLPPATLGSDEAVKRYVATRPDAIGYIDAGSVDESVRVALTFE